MRLEYARAQQPVDELVRKAPFAGALGRLPFGEQRAFDAPERLFLGDAGVGDAVEVAAQQRFLVRGAELPVMRQALVVLVRHQVEDVFLEIRAGAGNGVHIALADHRGERQAELRGAHGAGERHQHAPALVDVLPVGLGGVTQRRRVEVAEMAVDEVANGAHGAGTCWVRQWNAPRPTTRARLSIGTARRPGKQAARISSATRSAAQSNTGTSTTRLPM